MTREELADASEALGAAADEATGDLVEEIDAQADRLEDLAERDFDPDHGTLARVETKLGDLEADASGEIELEIQRAHELVVDYRSGVEGV